MKRILTLALLFVCTLCFAQVNYNAQTVNSDYTGVFRPGNNLGYFPLWEQEELGDLVAGNPATNTMGVGAKTIRPVLSEKVLEIYGYDVVQEEFAHWTALGMDEFTATLTDPVDWHRDQTEHCPGHQSEMFANLYTDIWDGGANGTPYNDENYFAAYVYKTVMEYNEYVRFWEIWNEPAFDLTGNKGWREPGDPQGNWWDNDPDPCDYILRAPIEDYVRTVRIGYEVIKTIAPEDYVVVGGMGYQSFMDAFLRNTDNPDGGSATAEYPHGGGAYFEVMGLHSYPHIDGTTRRSNENFFERHSDQAAQGLTYRRDFFGEILGNYGYDGNTYPKKQTIATEMNNPREFSGDSNYFASTLGQRNYIMKCYITAITNNVHQFHVYSMSNKEGSGFGFGDMGIYEDLYNTPPFQQEMEDEGVAMKTTSDMLFGNTWDEDRTDAMNLPDGVKGYAFARPDGKYLYMMWAATTIDQSEFAEETYSFPSGFEYNQLERFRWNYSITDNSSTISPNGIELDATPIFLLDGGGNDFVSIDCPDNILVEIPFGSTSGQVSWSTPTANSNCTTGSVTVTQTDGPSAGASFSLGVTTISYSASNGCNQVANCSFTVSITEGDDPSADCNPKGEAPWQEYIAHVNLVNLDNASGKCDTECGYGDFTNLEANVNTGQSYDITLTPGLSWPGQQADLYWSVWIDFNDDGDFTDAGEMVLEEYGSNQVVNGSISISSSIAQDVVAEMRIAAKKGSYATPCEVFSLGEVEDYSVNISAGACPDVDGDGICAADDCDDNNANLPATPGSPCDDDNPNTENDMIQGDGCTCEGDEPQTGCAADYSVSGSTIIVTGLTGAHNKIKLLDGNWDIYFSCLDNCDTPTHVISNLPDGNYNITIRIFDANWSVVCVVQESLVISGGSGCPNVGQSCNDNDACTTNDVIDANCDCNGTYLDSDNDTVCDAEDLCPGFDDSIDTNGNSTPDDCEGSQANCYSNGAQPWNQWIKNVTVGSIDNASSKCDTDCGYGDFTNLSTTAVAGNSYDIILTSGYGWVGHDEYWTIWVDWNENDVFDSNELAFSQLVVVPNGEYENTTIATIAVPSSVATTSVRMRIQQNGENMSGACDQFMIGEVEDYTLDLVGNSPGGFRSDETTTMATTQRMSLFPNPLRGESLYINTQGFEGESIRFLLTNMLGEVVNELAISEVNNSLIEWNTGRLSTGTYFVTLVSGRGTLKSLPLVVVPSK